MITLSGTLAAHQKGASRRPYLQLTAQNRRNGAHLLRWSRWYTGAETDSPHASAVAGDGSLLRARNDAGTLYTSRVAAPASGSTYSSWTSTQTGLVAGSGVALATRSGEALLLYTKGTTLYFRTSADNGATWGAETVIVNEGSAIGAIALAFTGSDACAFYVVGTSTTLKRLRRTTGTWAGSGTNWSRSGSVASLTGVGATHDGSDFALLITGTEVTTLHKRAWAAQMGDLVLPINAWSTLASVAESDAASTSTFAGPFCVALGAEIHGSYAQKEAGNVAYNRAYETLPPAGGSPLDTWTEPAPHEAATAYGLALAYSAVGASTSIMATTPSGVWACTISQSSSLDARVISCKVRLTATTSRCTVELDNADGLLNNLPSATFPGALVGGTLTVAPGYLSDAGGAAEYGVTWRFTVAAAAYALGRSGRRIVTLEAVGPWEQAARWHAPQAWQAAAGALTRAQLFARLAARAGGISTSSASAPHAPSSDWTAYSPTFVLAQGESAKSALARLLEPVTDAASAETGSFVVTGTTNSSSEVTYGGSGNLEVSALALADEPPPHNWARLQGPDRYADAVDAAGVYQHGPHLEVLRVLDATTNARATAWAANALDRRLLAQPLAVLVAPFNAGLQLFDLVSVTEPRLGLSATTYRVLTHQLAYERGPAGPRYDSTITLGGP
jgi:hypothetical protein